MSCPASRRFIPLVLLSACAGPQVAEPPAPRCPTVEIRDGEPFSGLAARIPGTGQICLRYHRARSKVRWAETPREAAPILTLTRSAIELHEAGSLVGAWYGPCEGAPRLRGPVSSEAAHYMLRFMTLRRPTAVQVRVGAGVSTVDLMFALETINDFGHRVHLDPRPVSQTLGCGDGPVEGVEAPEPVAVASGVLGAVVAPRLPMLQSCFKRTVRPLACSALVRRVDIAIDRHGMISDAAVADHTLGTPDVDACVGAAIWDLVFPPPPDGRPREGILRFQDCEQTPGAAPTLDL